VERLRESVHPWHAVPISLAVITLTSGGFWLGSVVGGRGHADAATLTTTVRIQGQVITIGGTRYVSTPAQLVRIRGKDVRLAARTVPLSGTTAQLAGQTTQLPGQTIRVPTTVNNTSVATVVRTVTVPVTVTGPASTVTGPTTTVERTVTVPLISTVTITLP
jgi:hypothetical protein